MHICTFLGPGLKDHYKVHFIHSGEGLFRVDNKVYHLSKGQGFLICPNSISFYKADIENPWTYSWVAFNGLNSELYLSRANLSIDKPIFQYERDDKFINCFEQMFDISEFMKNPSLSLGEISLSVGYKDLFQFSKIFKKFKGMSPNTFRNVSDSVKK